MADNNDLSEPRTPARQTRQILGPPLPNRSQPEQVVPVATTISTTTDPSELVRQQLAQMQQQMNALKNQIRANSSAVTVTKNHQSREYWATPIDKSVAYPGEDSAKTAKLAYKQKLDAYLRKCVVIWDLIQGRSPCPITLDADAMDALELVFGNTWSFEPKDIHRSMVILKREDSVTHDRVESAMTAGADTPEGSWADRNAALYTVVCATLDLSKKWQRLGLSGSCARGQWPSNLQLGQISLARD